MQDWLIISSTVSILIYLLLLLCLSRAQQQYSCVLWRELAPTGLWASLGKLHGDVWEKHRLIERVCQSPLFTGKAKCKGQTPGEMFLLHISGQTLLLSPSLSSPYYTKPLQTQQMLWRGCLGGTFPIQTPHCFHFSCFIVFISLCGLLLHWSCSLCWLFLPLCL